MMTEWTRFLFFGLSGLIFLGCSNGPSPPHKEGEHLQESSVVSLNLVFVKQCVPYHCQSYQISLSGAHLMKKLRSDNQKGTMLSPLTKRLSVQETEQVSALIKKLNLQSMQTAIVPGQSECANYSSDADRYRLEIKKGKYSQTLQIYAGCHDLAERYLGVINWFEQHAHSMDSPSS